MYLNWVYLFLSRHDMSQPPTPTSPTSTTPLLSGTTNTTASGSSSVPRYRSVGRAPTFMQTSVPNRRSITRAFLNITVHMMTELVLPILLYYVLRLYMSPLPALVFASAPPALTVVFKAIRDRKVDMMSLLIFLSFAASAMLALGSSDAKLYILRESAMTFATGCMLLATLIPLKWKQHILRPFMFYVGRRIAVSGTIMLQPYTVTEHWDWFWDNWRTFRLYFRILTGLWGVGLVSEFMVRLTLLYSMDDVDDIMYYSNIYMFIVTFLLGVSTVGGTLLFRHLYNQEQKRSKMAERRSEVESIIARAREEGQHA